MVAYDPTGLPGKFSKSIEVVFQDTKGKTIRRYLTIKGLTVSLTAKHFLAHKDTLQKEKNVVYYYQQKELGKKLNVKDKAYKEFIQKATKVALMHKKVKILITIYHKEPDFAFEKILKDAYHNVVKDLTEEGIPEQNIIFLDPMAELSSDKNYLQLSVVNQDSYTIPSLGEIVLAEVPTIIDGKEKKMRINSAQQLALPVYFQYFTNGLRDIDTSSQQFKQFLEELTIQIKGKEKLIGFLIVSSASKWVYASDKFDNKYIATLRGNNSTQTFKDFLQQKGLEVNDFSFEKEIKVIGPSMNKRNYVPFFYRKFQYLKIIPFYKVEVKDKRGAEGYIHFYDEGMETLNPNEKSFLSFVNQIEYLIKTQGYAKIKLEGSSSKVTMKGAYANEKLAYTRIENLKDNLERELYKRGINPQRLEVVEELTFVQGPEPKVGEPHEYKKAQYVKAVLVN